MKKKKSTFMDMEEVINRPYITVEDIMVLMPANEKTVRKIASNIIDEMKAQNIPVFCERPMLVPTSRVLQAIGIKADYIRKQAKLMRDNL